MALHQETELPGVLLRNVMMGFVAAAIAACQSAPPEAGSAEAGAFPTDAYQRAAERGDPVFDFDTAASTLRVYAYRSGPLAQKGHNHVIVARDWRGALALDPEELGDSRLDLRIPAAGLQVDPPGVRAELGGAFGGELDAAARTGTRENMLGARLLDAEAYPVIAISLVGVTGELPRPILTLAVTVRGNRTEIDVPVAVGRQNGGIRAEGRAILRHEDLGLAPFTAAGGALRVAEPLMVAFELVGERRRPDD